MQLIDETTNLLKEIIFISVVVFVHFFFSYLSKISGNPWFLQIIRIIHEGSIVLIYLFYVFVRLKHLIKAPKKKSANKDNERRSDYRRNWNKKIELLIPGNTINGIAFNKSNSGLCFKSDTRLKKGQELKIRNKFLPNRYKTGVVRWVKRIGNRDYQVGLMLVKC